MREKAIELSAKEDRAIAQLRSDLTGEHTAAIQVCVHLYLLA